MSNGRNLSFFSTLNGKKFDISTFHPENLIILVIERNSNAIEYLNNSLKKVGYKSNFRENGIFPVFKWKIFLFRYN